MEKKYNPENYDIYLAEYMRKAYEALEDNNRTRFRLACAKITNEVKIQYKNNALSKTEAEEIKNYFWGLM